MAEGVDSTDLRILYSLGSEGSLAGVSEKLGLSQPAVSQRVKRLEAKLQVPLTERVGRSVRLTPAGLILASHGAKVVAELDEAFEKIAALKDDRGGQLRLVGFPSASATVVPDMMRSLASLAPGVTMQYREAEPPSALAMLRDGEVDCALIFDYQDTTKLPAGTVYKPLWREQLHLVIAADDARAAVKGAVDMADFRADHWIAGCEKCRGNLLSVAAEHGFEPDIIQETDNMPAMVAMVAAGTAVALVPGLALAGMRTLPEGAKAVSMQRARHRTVGLATTDTAVLSPAARLAATLAAEVDAGRWGLESL
ncbi:LysR family transcriptional regulator [Canibacter zhoujuaniae]|uniref:LysR family transcriptional regulator n=1 Tax=Canibacter zhoujuaniae TaxID=2708343 RepID=UPI001421DAFB|nr:LysR family transcriptional regulator [Canibacter zhoujuaniae]